MSDPFADMAIDSFVTFETCETAMDLTLNVTNTASGYIAGIVGRARHVDRDMTARERREHRREASRPCSRGTHRR